MNFATSAEILISQNIQLYVLGVRSPLGSFFPEGPRRYFKTSTDLLREMGFILLYLSDQRTPTKRDRIGLSARMTTPSDVYGTLPPESQLNGKERTLTLEPWPNGTLNSKFTA
ncbi:hypothetical protein Nepgr_005461 [Nepenthes gracilis]|uniref:Uncharacterized protein n=1 Tax=Nepenthes gracilis TaxID=150966 RepID=A0AAD3S371_NEPGR|nr:hypothetical protein Nepgr_005461 [Nepenthes gracilis]